MKAKILISAFWIICLLLAFAFKGHSQSPMQTIKELNKIGIDTDTTVIKIETLIADETWLTYTKTGAKVISYSESAFQAISLKFGETFKSINIKYKTDRHGPYKEYVIYMDQQVANNIKQWAKKNL